MQVRGGREPRHQRDVLNRIPAPVAAPSEHVVRPPHAKHEACGLEAPREQGEAPRVRDPGGIDAVGQKRGRREAEGHRERREACQHDRRVDEHAAVAQDRVEAEAVGRRDRQHAERAGNQHEDEQEEGNDRRHHACRIRGEASSERRACHQRSAAEQAEHQRPVEERAFLTAVEPGRDERHWRREVAVLDDVGEREVVSEQRGLQHD